MVINFILFFSLFPVWILSPQITYIDKFFFSLPFLGIFFFIKFFNIFKKNNNIYYFVISIILVYGLDQNLFFYLNFIKPYFTSFIKIFKIIYYAEIIFLSILFILIFFFIKKITMQSQKKEVFFKIYLSFLLAIFFVNCFNVLSSQLFIFKNTNKNFNFKEKTIVLIFDEMSGINSFETKYPYGDEFQKTFDDFNKKYNFTVFVNSYSLSDNTASSISNLLNSKNKKIRDESSITSIRKKSLKKSKNNFNEYDVVENNYFDKKKNISVIQNIHLNYCYHPNVSKCYQSNPYLAKDLKENNYVSGFKINYFSRFFSLWKLNGSIFGRLFWKLMIISNHGNSLLEPEMHKAEIVGLLNTVAKDLASNNFDLIFAHILAPHIPYAWTKDCKYDGRLINFGNFMSQEEKIKQHNIERKCIFLFLENFLEKIKITTDLKYLKIYILSDHGSRISGNFDQLYSNILLIKNNLPYREIKTKYLLQDLFVDEK